MLQLATQSSDPSTNTYVSVFILRITFKANTHGSKHGITVSRAMVNTWGISMMCRSGACPYHRQLLHLQSGIQREGFSKRGSAMRYVFNLQIKHGT